MNKVVTLICNELTNMDVMTFKTVLIFYVTGDHLLAFTCCRPLAGLSVPKAVALD